MNSDKAASSDETQSMGSSSVQSPKLGVLLVDVGTPNELSQEGVQEFLTEFLTDPFVIRGPRWIREILFKRIIIPLRASRSLEKYRKIWTPDGSPLRVQSEQVARSLEVSLNEGRALFSDSPEWHVTSAFRYGQPSISSALAALKKAQVQEVFVVPGYPQWALSTRGSLEDFLNGMGIFSSAEKGGLGFDRVRILPPFYDHSGFIQAQAQLLQEALPPVLSEEVGVVFSFHGVPKSHIQAVVPSCRSCLRRSFECRPTPKARPYCYRFQCYDTALRISTQVGLLHWDVAFQSRLGPLPWLEPSLSDIMDELIRSEVKTMIVQCPSFVVEGLETLEEIGQEARAEFLRRGGKEFKLVPAVNHSPLWIGVLKSMILQQWGVDYEARSTSSSSTPQ